MHCRPALSCVLLSGLSLAAGLAAGPVAAQALADPTRPPALVAPPSTASVAPAAPRAASAPAPVMPPRVQSVQLARNGAASALVDDRLVAVGDKVRDRTVVAIDAQGVELRGAKGSVERLPLLDVQAIQLTVLPASLSPAPVARLAGGKHP